MCHSVKCIKYICKYVNKGSYQAAFTIENQKDEIIKCTKVVGISAVPKQYGEYYPHSKLIFFKYLFKIVNPMSNVN
ncbi:Uncharacterized protein FWK35_00027544 [Aphis craccivora]|uniref:Uncharacterized protein n=1 Tax=Aphis craccivora TaxID=307492 RepID=A0A6G0X970_APHCR|nr:Uncharacterized protein FWK35_00027544 [Aphis craccivora]